jgi:chorismate dehydratase
MSAAAPTLRIACVAFLNTRPLIWGLDRQPDVQLLPDVPSRLAERVRQGTADLGLLPVIDYQRLEGLQVVPSGCIGCDGHTLTVRIFARRPMQQIRTLACDTDSHTSVALARILLAERYGVRPTQIPITQATGAEDEARLLIGDKVICEEPAGFEVQLDLGHEWKLLTGLPFVFATWMARRGTDLRDLPQRLVTAREQGLANVHAIIEKHAVPRGWPAGIALQYLTVYLQYGVGERQLEAIRTFHALAHQHGVLAAPPRPIELF